MRRWSQTVLVPALMAAMWVCGCSEDGAPPNELTFVMSADSGDYNPLSQNFSWIGANFVGGQLMRRAPDGEWKPWIADSVDWDGPNVLIKLAGRFHSDGTVVSVDDVEYSLAVRADPKAGGNLHKLLSDNGFHRVERVSDGEVRVRFRSHWAPARNLVRGMTIWKKSLLEDIVQSGSPQNYKVAATDLVGAGPYRVTAFVPHAYLIAEPTGAGERLRIRTASEGAARRILFAERQADVMHIDQQQIRSFEPLARVMTSPYRDPVSLVMNMHPESLTGSHPDIRKAVMYATDSDLLRQIGIRDDSGSASGQLYTGRLSGWNHPEAATLVPQFDPEKANEILDEAYPVSSGRRRLRDGTPLKLTLITYALPLNKILSDRLAFELRRNLRIDVSVEQVPVGRFFDIMFHRDFAVTKSQWDMTIMAWPVSLAVADDPSLAQSLSSKSIPPNGFNIANLDDHQLDDLIAKADVESDEQERRRRYHDVHRRILELHVVKPICQMQTAFAVSDRVVGYQPDEVEFETLVTRWPELLRLRSAAISD